MARAQISTVATLVMETPPQAGIGTIAEALGVRLERNTGHGVSSSRHSEDIVIVHTVDGDYALSLKSGTTISLAKSGSYDSASEARAAMTPIVTYLAHSFQARGIIWNTRTGVLSAKCVEECEKESQDLQNRVSQDANAPAGLYGRFANIYDAAFVWLHDTVELAKKALRVT